jgi:hypothetical protein
MMVDSEVWRTDGAYALTAACIHDFVRATKNVEVDVQRSIQPNSWRLL